MSGKKNITIPYGYNPANNDIGFHNQVSGRNYEFWYAHIDTVKSVLGVATNNIGEICRSANINKWAAFKPTRYHPQQTDGHYHGMVPVGASFPYDWEYHGPRLSHPDPRDLGHFLGYNHNATDPGIVGHDSATVGLTKITGGYVWESAETQYTFEVQLRLPEWDVRSLARAERVWAKFYVNNVLISVTDVTITDAMTTNRAVYAQATFTPLGTWSNFPADPRAYRIELYLGDILGEDLTLSDTGEYYAHFPSDAAGLLSVQGDLMWRWEYGYKAIQWIKHSTSGGGSGTGSVRIKSDRLGVQADEVVTDANQLWAEGSNGQDPMHGWYSVSELEGYETLYYRFENGTLTNDSPIFE